jgi:NAD(P)-dependent dehydrogenase (short-subunit alcohol dehydrogenase family)
MNDKVVLITGAAHGLGRALTEVFLSKGWSVIATDVDEPAMMDFKKNPKISAMQMDVTSDESVKSTFEKVVAEKINIDIIINNAGIDRYFPLSEAPVEMIKEIFEVNFFGGYRVNQIFLPIVRKPGGRIIHVSSESLHLNIPFMPYPISKMAVEGYAKTLRQEMKFSGIDVIIVRPGAIRTRLLDNVTQLKSVVGSPPAGEAGRQSALHSWHLAAQMEKFAEDAPGNIGKVLEPGEVAEFIFKVSQKSNPKAVYKINNSLQLKIASMLPFSFIEKAVGKKLSGK